MYNWSEFISRFAFIYRRLFQLFGAKHIYKEDVQMCRKIINKINVPSHLINQITAGPYLGGLNGLIELPFWENRKTNEYPK